MKPSTRLTVMAYAFASISLVPIITDGEIILFATFILAGVICGCCADIVRAVEDLVNLKRGDRG